MRQFSTDPDTRSRLWSSKCLVGRVLSLSPQFVDPRLVYQLIHFTQKRGGEQLQPEQVLTLAKVFCALNIFDEKAWKKLGMELQTPFD